MTQPTTPDAPDAGRDEDALTARFSPGVARGGCVLVPVGSLEQHGPHLPLDTDTVVAQAVAEATAARLRSGTPPGPVLVAPPLPYGASGEHQDFAGTISIGTDALVTVVVELVRSLHTWAGRVVLVNGHGGNVAALAAAVSRLRTEQHDVAWVACAVPGSDPHAGATETSLMLHLAPDRLDVAAAEAGCTEPLVDIMPALRQGGVAAVSPNGVLGDPTGATAADGERLFAHLVNDVTDLVCRWTPDTRGRLVRTGPQ